MATLRGLAEHCVEELKVLQTIMLLSSSTELIRGKIVSQASLRERDEGGGGGGGGGGGVVIISLCFFHVVILITCN